MQPDKGTGLRKRSQISRTNRGMFLWVAGSAVVVGVTLVISIFLVQKLVFNERILAEKQKTITTLDANNKVAPALKTEIRALDANADLAKVKANQSDQAIQVILDALPSEANSLALGASLQNKLLAGISGLTIVSLQVDPVAGVENAGDESTVDASTTTSDIKEITFQFSVSGNQAALKQVLTNLERSIRTIEILSLRIETQGDVQTMSIQGRAFYEPARNVKLYDKVVKP